MDWLIETKIPVGAYAKAGFDWLKTNAAPVFDAMDTVLEALIAAIQKIDAATAK